MEGSFSRLGERSSQHGGVRNMRTLDSWSIHLVPTANSSSCKINRVSATCPAEAAHLQQSRAGKDDISVPFVLRVKYED